MCNGPVLVESLKFHHVLQRQSRHDVLRTIAQAGTEGVFAERGVTAKAAVADLLLETPRQAKKLMDSPLSVPVKVRRSARMPF